MPQNAKRAVVYARLSVASDDSVSIARQVESCTQYAEARGWRIVATCTDDGVSATHNKPEQRPGWREVLALGEPYDVVVVWKVDRLARRVLDFLHADEQLQERQAGVVAVEQPIDMTTPTGRAFATMLAVFAELEAEAISSRVKAARNYLIRNGRAVGGSVPYGWCNVKNEGAPGFTLKHDPEQIDFVRGAIQRVQAGDTLYAVKQWLEREGAPLPTVSQKGRKTADWSYSSVERLMRNPILAGMTALNPGNQSKVRGDEVLRGDDGLPVVRPELAVMSVTAWRAMVRRLDDRDSAQSRPRASLTTTSPLLSGLVWCADCDRRMHRGTTANRAGYFCPGCHQAITNFEHLVVEKFLVEMGNLPRWSVVEEVHEGGAELLPEIEHRLTELAAQLQATDDDEQADALTEQIARLRTMRREARALAPTVEYVPVREGIGTFAEDWTAAGTDVTIQREVLGDALNRIHVQRGATGRTTPAKVLARLAFDWKNPTGMAA